ncbi:hypothetical protein BJX61DRAFT_203934 [Aspergillus egyptiacus]|nr:hypothetical protein BJX61DRAFT_203934 [Aspergillus egyptiacus]
MAPDTQIIVEFYCNKTQTRIKAPRLPDHVLFYLVFCPPLENRFQPWLAPTVRVKPDLFLSLGYSYPCRYPSLPGLYGEGAATASKSCSGCPGKFPHSGRIRQIRTISEPIVLWVRLAWTWRKDRYLMDGTGLACPFRSTFTTNINQSCSAEASMDMVPA